MGVIHYMSGAGLVGVRTPVSASNPLPVLVKGLTVTADTINLDTSDLEALLGAVASTAYAGSGSAAITAILKGLYNLLKPATTTARLISAAGATTDKTLVKASAGTLYGIKGYNAAAAIRYLKIYDKGSAAPLVASDTPLETLVLPPLSGFTFDYPQGLTLANGLGFVLVTGNGDTNATSVTAGDILGLNIEYA